jgi:hypothetical protein
VLRHKLLNINVIAKKDDIFISCTQPKKKYIETPKKHPKNKKQSLISKETIHILNIKKNQKHKNTYSRSSATVPQKSFEIRLCIKISTEKIAV